MVYKPKHLLGKIIIRNCEFCNKPLLEAENKDKKVKYHLTCRKEAYRKYMNDYARKYQQNIRDNLTPAEKEAIKLKTKDWMQKYHKEYYQKNKEAIKLRVREYQLNKKKSESIEK